MYNYSNTSSYPDPTTYASTRNICVCVSQASDSLYFLSGAPLLSSLDPPCYSSSSISLQVHPDYWNRLLTIGHFSCFC